MNIQIQVYAYVFIEIRIIQSREETRDRCNISLAYVQRETSFKA